MIGRARSGHTFGKHASLVHAPRRYPQRHRADNLPEGGSHNRVVFVRRCAGYQHYAAADVSRAPDAQTRSIPRRVARRSGSASGSVCEWPFVKQEQAMDTSTIKAVTFDIFGTVVDWRGTLIKEGQRLGAAKGISIDWAAFADAWRSGYYPSMEQVRTGALPWQNIDTLHRLILDRLLSQFAITCLSQTEIDHLNRVWHRLEPWPDAKSGLERLRRCFVITPLSNGNMALLINLAKHADLRWDAILSAELARHYKPDPEVYLTAAALLGLEPHEVMMVAAHNDDLQGARAVGFRTAFVARSQEYGPNQTTDLVPDPAVDIAAQDFNDLADTLCRPAAADE